MKNFAFTLLSLLAMQLGFAQTNTFPATGNVGVGTTTPTQLFQVSGGLSQFGGVADFASFSTDGDLVFVGNADYLVGGDRYAFRYASNPNFGLVFSSSNNRYEFRDAAGEAVFWTTGSGNGYVKSKLAIGSINPPGAALDITSVNGAAIRINPYGVAAGNTSELRFNELAANGNNYVGFKAPDNISGNKIWVLPSNNGSAGQVLANNGSNNLYWADSSPDQIVTLTGDGVTTVSGTYPNFTVTTPEVAGPEGAAGADGAPGLDGTDGVGIVSTVDNGDGTFTIYYSDETSFTTADLTGPTGYLTEGAAVGNTPYWDGSSWVTNSSNIFNNGSNVGIGTTTPTFLLDVNGDVIFNGIRVGKGSGNVFSNTAIGKQALNSNLITSGNTAVGYQVLFNNSFAGSNTGVGCQALFFNTTGGANTAIGQNALFENINGFYNTATGFDALHFNTTGGSNTAFGALPLYSNTTGNFNTALGYSALYTNTNGGNNTAVGYNSMDGNTTGNFNTALGNSADVSSGSLSNAIVIGHMAIVDATNKARIGNTSISSIGGQVTWTAFSDKRIKNEVQENVPGIKFINELRPVTYHFDVEKTNALLGVKDTNEWEGKYDIEKIQFTGFIAQEVDAAAGKLGYDFSGVDKSGNVLGLRYAEFVVPLVKAVQELDSMNKVKDAEINSLESAVSNLEDKIDALTALVMNTTSAQNTTTTSINLSEEKTTSTITINGAWMEQNVPNPFTGATVIRCYIPEGFTSAEMVITAQNGVTLKRATLNQSGINEVTIDVSAISSGAYQYTLIVDGQIIGTKQMLLTK